MFVKLYGSLVMSSMWSEDTETRVLWITMLATADRDGFLFGSPAGLAAVARLPVDSVLKSLEKLKAPDPMSSDLLRNPENEGRRVEAVEGGWKLLNYEWYRGLERAEDRKAQYRESKRKQRNKVDGPQMSPGVPKSPPSEAEAEAEADPKAKAEKKEASTGRFPPPASIPEVKAYASEKGWDIDAAKFVAYYTSIGWKVGKNAMKNWHAAVYNWYARDKS